MCVFGCSCVDVFVCVCLDVCVWMCGSVCAMVAGCSNSLKPRAVIIEQTFTILNYNFGSK